MVFGIVFLSDSFSLAYFNKGMAYSTLKGDDNLKIAIENSKKIEQYKKEERITNIILVIFLLLFLLVNSLFGYLLNK